MRLLHRPRARWPVLTPTHNDRYLTSPPALSALFPSQSPDSPPTVPPAPLSFFCPHAHTACRSKLARALSAAHPGSPAEPQQRIQAPSNRPSGLLGARALLMAGVGFDRQADRFPFVAGCSCLWFFCGWRTLAARRRDEDAPWQSQHMRTASMSPWRKATPIYTYSPLLSKTARLAARARASFPCVHFNHADGRAVPGRPLSKEAAGPATPCCNQIVAGP